MDRLVRIGLGLFSSILVAGLAAAQETSRESVDSTGTQGNGPSGWVFKGQALSSDGHFVAFMSWATNLVAGDTNARSDVFRRDRSNGAITRVSVDSSGLQANGDSGGTGVSISGDGRFIVFSSLASNLVGGGTAGIQHIYLHDMSNGATTRLSVDSAGAPGNGHSYQPCISADGQFVAFGSYATNLVAGDTNGISDVFVHDRLSGATIRASVDSNGLQANPFCPGGSCEDGSYVPVLSGDGRYVAFDSYVDNLVTGDTNLVIDIFVHDCLTGATVRVNLDSGGIQSNADCYVPALSADGRYVSFNGPASNLVPNDTNGCADVFVHDMLTGATARVSLDSAGGQCNNHAYWSTLSADGRFVAFDSFATNLAGSDNNNKEDVFLHDTQSGATTRISIDYQGLDSNDESSYASISADGMHVVFASRANDLVTNDVGTFLDVFTRDLDQPGDAFCFGDGSSGTCPCANSGASGRGCENSAATGGALLESAGEQMILHDTLVLTSSGELPVAPSLFLQGDAAIGATNFGDGLRCVGGSLKRLYVKIATGGSVTAPQPGDPSISARSAALGDTLAMGLTRHYQVYYRDSNLGFCPGPAGDSWNVSNALSVTWLP